MLGIKECSGQRQLQVHLGVVIPRDVDPVHAEIPALELGAASDGDVRVAQQQAKVSKASKISKACSTAEGSL